MIKLILLVILVLIGAFLIYVSTREEKFKYLRSGLILASPDEIYPLLVKFSLWAHWHPFEKLDPKLKKNFSNQDGTVGAVMRYEGNRDVGAGSLELLELFPNEGADFLHITTQPLQTKTYVQFRLSTEPEGTRFTWIISGDGGFLGKFMNVFVDCQKLAEDQMDIGIANIKSYVESLRQINE